MTTVPNLPLFFKSPQPVSHAAHGAVRIKNGDMSFAASSPSGPITLGEFPHAVHDYPIVFAASTAAPIAVWGIERENLFVSDGQWDQSTYVPAYVRRYPFSTVRFEDDQGFALVVDGGCDRLVQGGEEGVPLFDGDQPSEYTRRLMSFCQQFHADALATEAFSKALLEADILVDRRADITLPNGAKTGINGFLIVDPARLAKLDEKVIVDWHRRNWLPAIHFHLLSLSRFETLLQRRARATPAAAA